jgi:hypothetical protein
MGEALVWTGMMLGGPPNLRDGLLTPMHIATLKQKVSLIKGILP